MLIKFPKKIPLAGFFINPIGWRFIPVARINGDFDALSTHLAVPRQYRALNLFGYATAVEGWIYCSFKQSYGGLIKIGPEYTQKYWTICISKHWVHKSMYQLAPMRIAEGLEKYHNHSHNVRFNLDACWIDEHLFRRSERIKSLMRDSRVVGHYTQTVKGIRL